MARVMSNGVVVTSHVLALALLTAAAAAAQDPPPAVPVPPPVTPVAEAPAVPPAPPRPIDVQRRREQIALMEGVLAAAVRNGAIATAREVQMVQPGVMFSGPARAKGFVLEGYGVFFHVEIPGVQQSVAYLLQTIERERASRAGVNAPVADPTPTRIDADAVYTNAVKQKIIDVMLDYNIDLTADEWLTVAARDGDTPLVPVPGPIYESITMILRVKGADLNEFRAGRLSKDEVRRRVEVKEF